LPALTDELELIDDVCPFSKPAASFFRRDDRAAWISVRIYMVNNVQARWADLHRSGKEASSSGQESLLAREGHRFPRRKTR
jgi:hypothetical protein